LETRTASVNQFAVALAAVKLLQDGRDVLTSSFSNACCSVLGIGSLKTQKKA